MRILIIDDDELDRMAVVRALTQAGIAAEVTQASTAQEGLALAREKTFEVVLLDFRLPDRDGIEVLKELRQSDTRNATFVMLSHNDDARLAEQAIDAGAQDFLLKDEVSGRRLQRAVHQAQHRRKLEEALDSSREQLRRAAEHDSLTGLANRYDFERALNQALARRHRSNSNLAVLLLDIDNFKTVNDTFGHDVGDKLLVEVANRLRRVVRDSDLLARLGGDEFVILAVDMEHDEQSGSLARRIVDAFAEPMVLGDAHWSITTSVGIATHGDSAATATELMKCADIAMYRAKQSGRNQAHFYSDALHQTVLKRISLERDMRQALARRELQVYYQAQVCARSGKLSGLEALLRWHHPKLGVLPPAEFIPVAEELGLMRDIGQWVLNTACDQLQDWRNRLSIEGLRVAVAVNLSAVQLEGDELLGAVQSALSISGLDPASLELEITENVLIKNPTAIAAMLNAITDLGIRLSLDDFGTGFSSFEHLRLFPIHTLKIDRCFVDGIGQGVDQERLLSAMIRFAQTLQLRVIAEGVETEAQARFCSSHGCNLLQGFFYSKPLPAEAFEHQYLRLAEMA